MTETASVVVVVVGAGVVGLTTAITLQERGIATRVVARDLPPLTTSDVPAAFFHPYKAEPWRRILGWTRASWARFRELAGDPAAGVRLMSGVEVIREAVAEPWWKDAVETWRRARPDELPPWAAGGFVFESAVIETPVYMPWLVGRYLAAGGTIERGEVADLAAVASPGGVVVHCAGLGARELASDPEVYPSRGQLVHLDPTPVTLDRFALDVSVAGAVTYVVPRRDVVVCGGTAEDGVESVAIDAADTAAILARARALVPGLERARPRRAVAGIRPCRSEVRLEAETRAGGVRVVHNYGHGGAGHTLSWGCAAEAADLVERWLDAGGGDDSNR